MEMEGWERKKNEPGSLIWGKKAKMTPREPQK